MASSKPMLPDSTEDIPVVGQHYLVCGTKDCKRNCQFYCNPCHLQLCEKCRDEHQKGAQTGKHEMVPYKKRKRQLPEEKCLEHPTRNIDMVCDDCQVLVCSKCATQDHRRHALTDLETIYSENYALCLKKVYQINRVLIPGSNDMEKEIEEDVTEIKSIMNTIRECIKTDAKKHQSLVDEVVSDNMEQVNRIEESLMDKLQSQDKTYRDYTLHLERRVKEFHSYLSSTKLQSNPIIFALFDHLQIKPVPATTKPIPPVFAAVEYGKDDVAKLLGRILVPTTKPKNRIKQLVKSLSSMVTRLRDYSVPSVYNVYHVSLGIPDKIWVSDSSGNLVQIDLDMNKLLKIQTSGGNEGYHTVTLDGDLIYADKDKKIINKISQDHKISELIKTEDWEPISIHSSNTNGDILIGMAKDEVGKVTRFSKTGKEIHNIQVDQKRRKLYRYPHYITENTNGGDVCTSDLNKRTVEVVNKSGQYRFSYKGQRAGFNPYGICSDILGHILVCDVDSNTVHILHQDGQFLTLLHDRLVKYPCSVSVDDESNLHVGWYSTNKVTVYKHLE